jgi:hypothetical protein
MKITKIAVISCASAFALVTLAAPLSAAELTDQNKRFLAAYEQVHHALVADDLAGAQTAAADLGRVGVDLTKSKSLTEARAAFEKLSAQTKDLVAGQPGYFVLHCPMANKDWVQTSDKPSNPYFGKQMPACGEVKK